MDSADLKLIETRKASTRFRFWNDKWVQSKTCEDYALIGGKKVLTETDVVGCDIAVLLSKEVMKKAKMSTLY